MIQANVAAAETLEARKSPLVYRIHDAPSLAKLEGLRDFLKSIELSLPKGGNLRPAQFNRLLERVRGDREWPAAPRGGAAHPGAGRIQPREHRPFRPQPAPLRPLHLADPPLCRPDRPPRAGPLAEARPRRPARRHRGSDCRRSPRRSPPPSAAPWRPSATPSTGWSPIGSPTASAPPSHGRISGVTRAGLFVKLNETGADGFVPMRTLGSDYFHYDEARHAVIGSRAARCTGWATRVEVKLVEAVPLAGALRFELLSEGKRGTAPRHTRQGRDEPRRHQRKEHYRPRGKKRKSR